MEIAAFTVIHDNPQLVLDTLESVRHWMTPRIVAVVDGASDVYRTVRTPAWLNGQVSEIYAGREDRFRDFKLPAYRIDGLRHGFHRAPYRNMVLGLQAAVERWNVDWYCYIEPDCLVGNNSFLHTLEEADKRGFTCLGNDLRYGQLKFPLLEKIANRGFVRSAYLLGCCVFLSKAFIDELKRIDFFNRFLVMTNDFSNGFFPGVTEQNVYDFGEYLFPTLASNMVGYVGELACWDQAEKKWLKRHSQFPMRFRPDLDAQADGCYEAAIMHPIKDYAHPARAYHRKLRNKNAE